MAYSWNLVRKDIERLTSLFKALSRTFRKQITYRIQIIDYELQEKWVESEELLRTLAEMVKNFEKRYKVDDEEKQDEGGALDDEEKQHERSVLELKKHERIVIELWLEELQEAVFNTEDLVDKIHTEALRYKLDGQVSGKMEGICCCIESYVKAGHVLGLAEEKSYQLQKDHICFVDESEVFVGNGRIGKTTLARLVYNEQRVSHHFDRKAWVDVPDDFKRVTQSIGLFLARQCEDRKEKFDHLKRFRGLDQHGFELQNCLKGKRFLLVLDGAKQIPSSEGWEALRSAFKFAANGSHIIVTTRNKDIAPMMDAVRTHRMEPLSEEKCWPMFAKFAFGDQNPSSDTQLEVIGKEIVQMCHGLPSSVRILGCLLFSKLQRKEWKAMLERLKPSSDSREDSRENVNVVPNLRLPEDLKRCLAYCSIFPQDYEFHKEKLILLCMAEGFLEPPTQRKTMKQVSESINELNSFFQKSSRNESSFQMCMNNLAAYVSTRYCFRLEDNHPSQIPLNTRYLSLVGGKYENSVIFEATDRAKLLRTFLPLNHESRHLCATELQNLLSKLQFLRVLSLSHYKITEIPDSIGNLEHLRYIDLSHTPIKRLPELVFELYNLRSLILSNCHSLTELLEITLNLENLINLDVSGSGLREMPKGMRKLRNLKLLPCFVVGKKSGSALGELNFLSRLQGTLHISKLQNVTSEYEAAKARLRYQPDLHELVLEWDENTADPKNATEVLEGIRPDKHLEKLTINFYNDKEFAKWINGWKFDRIFFLRLSNCKNCSSLPSLRNLPSLRVLIIECMDAVEEMGPDFSSKLSTGMQTALERLTFEGMSKWTKWVPSNMLPCLQQLCIRRCPKLRGNLPKELPLVERVEISESQELVTALTTEASLNNLHYREKIVFISDDKVTSFTSEGAAGSSSLMIEGTEESGEREPETHSEFGTASETEESKLELSGTEESRESEQATHLEAETASETEGRKLEQEKSTKDPSPSLSSEEKSSLPTTQEAVESSLPVSQTPNLRDKADDPTNTRPQDGPQDLSFKSMKVSGILQPKKLPGGLHSLRIEGCDALEEIPEGIMAGLNQLQHLYIINCCSLNSLPEDHPPTALKKFYVQNCKKLKILKTSPYALLEHLCITG